MDIRVGAISLIAVYLTASILLPACASDTTVSSMDATDGITDYVTTDPASDPAYDPASDPLYDPASDPSYVTDGTWYSVQL